MARPIVRPAIMVGVAVVALFLSACGGSSNRSSMPGTSDSPNASTNAGTATGTVSDADVAFAQNMIPHHRQAVEMSQLAETRANDPEVKKLAEQIKTAQQPEIATMTGWLTSWGKRVPEPGMSGTGHGVDPRGTPGMMTDADMEKLEAASGTRFDKQFLTMMIDHHEGAITMATDEVASGTHAGAKALAQQIITAQQAEIDTMNKILARL